MPEVLTAGELVDRSYYFPSGKCLGDSPHAQLDVLGITNEVGLAGLHRLALIEEAENACRTCNQYALCSEPEQNRQLVDLLWSLGVGVTVVGGEVVDIPAGEVSPLNSEDLIVHFDYQEMPEDADRRLALIRQAVRSGDLDPAKHSTKLDIMATSWLKSQIMSVDPGLYDQAVGTLGEKQTTASIKYIAKSLIEVQLFGLTGDERNSRREDILRSRSFMRDLGLGILYLGDVIRTHILVQALDTKQREGNYSKVPALALRHSPEYTELVINEAKSNYPSIKDTGIRYTILQYPDQPRNALGRFIASASQDRHDRLDVPRGRTRERLGQMAVGDVELPGDYDEFYAILTSPHNLPYLRAYRSTIVGKSCPLDFVRQTARKISDLVEDPEIGVLIATSRLDKDDIGYCAVNHPEDAVAWINKYATIRQALSAMYANNPKYTLKVLKKLSRRATKAEDLEGYYSNLLDLETESDGRVSIENLHRYALRGPITYEQLKKSVLCNKLYSRYTTGVNSSNGSARFVKRNKWMFELLAETDGYTNEQVFDVAEQMIRGFFTGRLRVASVDLEAYQVHEQRDLADNISSPKGNFITFSDAMWQLPPQDRLAYAYSRNLGPILYGRAIDRAELEAFVGTRDISGYVTSVLNPRVDALRTAPNYLSPEPTTVGNIYADLRAIDGYSGSTPVNRNETVIDGRLRVAQMLGTVVGEYIVGNVLAEISQESTGLNEYQYDWLMYMMPRLYPPGKFNQVITNIASLNQLGLIEIARHDEDYSLRFADGIYNVVPGVDSLSSLDISILATHFDIDLFTHINRMEDLVQERLYISEKVSSKASLQEQAELILQRALQLINRNAPSTNPVDVEAATLAAMAQPAESANSTNGAAAERPESDLHANEAASSTEIVSDKPDALEIKFIEALRRWPLDTADIASMTQFVTLRRDVGRTALTRKGGLFYNRLGDQYKEYVKSRQRNHRTGRFDSNIDQLASHILSRVFGSRMNSMNPTPYQTVVNAPHIIALKPNPDELRERVSKELVNFMNWVQK